MAINTQVRKSPGWVLDFLWKRLLERQDSYTTPQGDVVPSLDDLDRYRRGRPPMPVGADGQEDAYAAFQRTARSNFAELIIEAPRERMIPLGFRTGADGDDDGDAEAMAIWRENDGDVLAADVHATMLALRDAYVIVGIEDGRPVYTAEDPRQVITLDHPRRHRRVEAALKVYYDDYEGRAYAYLFVRDEQGDGAQKYVAFVETDEPAGRSSARPYKIVFDPQEWSWDPDAGGEEGTHLPAMPVVRFRNKDGVGEYEPHLDLLDRINHMLLQRLMIATLQAFKQRALMQDDPNGDALPEEDEEGNKIDWNYIFSADPGALWKMPPGVKIWESGQVDLQGILSAVKDDVAHLAAVTRTPLHYFTPDAANGSAEGASLMREGLVSKAGDRCRRAGPSWELVQSTGFRLLGDDQRADLRSMRVMWANPEIFSLTEKSAAAVQAQAAGVPWRGVMLDFLQLDPETVDRYEAWRLDDSIHDIVAGANAPGGGVPATGSPNPARPGGAVIGG